MRDSPRPEGYWPGTPSQWREATVDDCTWYATEFLFEAAGRTHHSMHPVRELRALSSDKVGGTPLTVAIGDTLRIWPASENVGAVYGTFSRLDIVRALSTGAGILWGGDYVKLPPHYRRWTNHDEFSHAMASLTFDKETQQTFLYDPLGGGPTKLPYDGEWIGIDDLLAFNWSNGQLGYYVGIVQNKGDGVMRFLHLPTSQRPNKTVALKHGASAFAEPRATGEPVRRFFNENKQWPYLGKGWSGWYIVLWNDGETGDTWDFGFVPSTEVLEVVNVPIPPVEGVNCDEFENTLEIVRTHVQELADLLA